MSDAIRAGVTWECDESRADDPDHEWDDNPIGSRYVRFTAVVDRVDGDLVELTVTRSNPHHASPDPDAQLAKSVAKMRAEAKWEPYNEPTPEGNTETHVADEDCVLIADGGKDIDDEDGDLPDRLDNAHWKDRMSFDGGD